MLKRSKLFGIFSVMLVLVMVVSACASAAQTPAAEESVAEQPAAEEAPAAAEEPAEEAPAEEAPMAEPVEITYFTFSAAPDHLGELDQMVQLFEASHPDIKVKVETAPYDSYFTKLQTLVAGGTVPDVFELNYENFVTYAEKGLLYDLSPMMAADTMLDPDVYSDGANAAFNYKGAQLGLPATFSTVVLYYNKDLFDAAGVAYPTADWTWADAVEAGKQLNDPDNGVWGLYSGIQFWEFYKKAAQNNCQFFNEEKTESLINSPECLGALTTMVDLVKVDKVVPSSADMGGISDGDMFVAGKLAMDVSGIWMFAAYKDAPFNWDITVEPGMATKATHFFANAATVSASTEKAEAAYEWVKFFTSAKEMADIRIASGWELPAVKDPAVFADYLAVTPPANRQAVIDSLDFAVVPPVIVRQAEMQDGVGLLLDKVMLDELTPQEALDEMKTLLDSLIQ